MATLQQRIEGYVGTLTMSSTALQDALGAEACFLIRSFPAERLVEYATVEQLIGNEGADISEKRIVKVYRNSYEAQFVGTNTRLIDSDSLFYAAARTPVYEMDSREGSYKLYIHPYATEFEPGLIYHIAFPSSVLLSASSVTGLPNEAVEAVVLSGCVSELVYRINGSVDDLGTALYTSVSAPDLSIDYTDVQAALADDDFEKVSSELDYISSQIQEYTQSLDAARADISNNANEYTDGINRLLKKIESNISERANMLSLYQQELQKLGLVSRPQQQ